MFNADVFLLRKGYIDDLWSIADFTLNSFMIYFLFFFLYFEILVHLRMTYICI